MQAATAFPPDSAVSAEKYASILLGGKTNAETACETTQAATVYLLAAAISVEKPASILLGDKTGAEEPFEKTEAAAIPPPSFADEEIVSDEPLEKTKAAAVSPTVAALSEEKPALILLGDKTNFQTTCETTRAGAVPVQAGHEILHRADDMPSLGTIVKEGTLPDCDLSNVEQNVAPGVVAGGVSPGPNMKKDFII